MNIRRFFLASVICSTVACGGLPSNQGQFTFSVPNSAILSGGPFSTDPKLHLILDEQSGTLGDFSKVLNGLAGSNLGSVPLSNLDIRTFSSNSPLLSGPNPVVSFSSGQPILDVSALASTAANLKKEIDDLKHQRDEEEAFLKLNAGQVRALEKALGISAADRWIDRFASFGLGVLTVCLTVFGPGFLNRTGGGR